MSQDIERFNIITEKIIGCAIEVHRNLGPGLLESIYEKALCIEFDENQMKYERQFAVPIIYKGNILGEFRIDLFVEKEIIVELKAVDKPNPVFEAQVLSYLKTMNKKLGLLINFNVPVLRNGIKRVILESSKHAETHLSKRAYPGEIDDYESSKTI
jgi:GxxExxY protein